MKYLTTLSGVGQSANLALRQQLINLRRTSVWPMDAQSLDDLAVAFRPCTLPRAEWTHPAHLRVGAWHVHVGDIALGPAYLYFLSDGLARVPKAGRPIETILSKLSAPGLLQVSGADVVWVDNSYRALSSTALTPIEALCVGGTSPTDA
jgi:hypothetical protein